MTTREKVMQIFVDNYDKLVLIAKKNLRYQFQTDNYEFDLVSHFLISLNKTIENDNSKFDRMIYENKLIGYLCRSIYLNCTLETAPYIRDLICSRKMTSSKHSTELYEVETLIDNNRTFIELHEIVFNLLNPYDCELFFDYSMNEYTVHEIALKYGLSMSQAATHIEEIKTKLKETLR